ncbi:TYR [Ectocarpus sp. CCAP 1310/34]|nr:TYR [Ectocarpus sp. CCAP 1310/34]
MYGSIAEDEESRLARRSKKVSFGNMGERLTMQPDARPWWSLVGAGALVLGAAVVAFAFDKIQVHTAASPRTSGARLGYVVTPSEKTQATIQQTPHALPNGNSPTTKPKVEAAAGVGEVAPLSFQALNFYHIRDGKPAQDYPWLKGVKLIEPHRETTLSVSSPRDGHDYIWEVRAGETDEANLVATARGAEAVVTLTTLDDNVITVKEVHPDGHIVRRLDEVVMVKYVRREIRTLTDEEREELLDAMHQLWVVRVSGGNGIEQDGDGYADMSFISRLHFKAAQNGSCDHVLAEEQGSLLCARGGTLLSAVTQLGDPQNDEFHEGLGFLTSHSMLTNTFEYSLQQVNPKLTVPYWDFTIEYVEAETDGDDEIKINSPLFQESWFGTADPVDNVAHFKAEWGNSQDARRLLTLTHTPSLAGSCILQVKDGRWANTAIPRTDPGTDGDLIPDVYGLLRSRWVVNSSPPTVHSHLSKPTEPITVKNDRYLTRGLGKLCGGSTVERYGWPSCEDHHNLVMDYDDFYSWVSESMNSPHGPVHTWIAGVLNCEDTISSLSSLVGENNANSLLNTFKQRKLLWSYGMFGCEGFAAEGIPTDELLSSGKCGCLGYNLSQGDDWKTIYANPTSNLDDFIGDYDDETKRQVVAAVCASTIYYGDHLHVSVRALFGHEAGSSLDPTFWPMHPTIERLFVFSALTGQLTNFHWPDSELSYTDTNGDTVVETTSNYGDKCYGHGGSDVFPFGLLDNDDDALKIKTGMQGNGETGNTLTNREALANMDGRFNNLPYVYDNFKWEHCLDSGIDFDDAWDASTT